ncbi:MAG: LPS-assembly protein LptD, partial [Sphingomonas sp.]
NRGLTVTPRFYSNALPLLGVDYQALTESGAYRVQAYGTASRRTDATGALSTTGANVFRGYLDIAGRFQLSPNWSVSASLRLTTDRTFLRRYDISRDDLLRDTVRVERIDRDSYLSIAGWAVQTLRVGDRQGLQPFALPEIDYRHRFGGGISGAVLTLQVNTLGVERSAGQDTQRAFASAEWVLRRITAWGQEVSVTAYGRGDLYHADDTVATNVVDYRGKDGVQGRVIGALAFDVKWPFVGPLFGGTQRLTPRVQLVAAPRLANISVPNEDARAVDLEDSNLFALNRFPGYDRFEDSSRVTYGLEWALNIPDLTVDATVGQSVRLTSQSTLVPQGTGFASRVSDIVGRTEARYKDFFSVVHRYRFDKNSFVIRRNEVDATIGSRDTYFLVGYLRLNRTITTGLEDLRNRQEARVGGRIALTRFWSVFGSAVVDLTTKNEDPLTVSNGFTPIRHRVGVAYEDDCLRLGVTWKRDYQDTGDARRGNSFLLTLAFKNLGR